MKQYVRAKLILYLIPLLFIIVACTGAPGTPDGTNTSNSGIANAGSNGEGYGITKYAGEEFHVLNVNFLPGQSVSTKVVELPFNNNLTTVPKVIGVLPVGVQVNFNDLENPLVTISNQNIINGSFFALVYEYSGQLYLAEYFVNVIQYCPISLRQDNPLSIEPSSLVISSPSGFPGHKLVVNILSNSNDIDFALGSHLLNNIDAEGMIERNLFVFSNESSLEIQLITLNDTTPAAETVNLYVLGPNISRSGLTVTSPLNVAIQVINVPSATVAGDWTAKQYKNLESKVVTLLAGKVPSVSVLCQSGKIMGAVSTTWDKATAKCGVNSPISYLNYNEASLVCSSGLYCSGNIAPSGFDTRVTNVNLNVAQSQVVFSSSFSTQQNANKENSYLASNTNNNNYAFHKGIRSEVNIASEVISLDELGNDVEEKVSMGFVRLNSGINCNQSTVKFMVTNQANNSQLKFLAVAGSIDPYSSAEINAYLSTISYNVLYSIPVGQTALVVVKLIIEKAKVTLQVEVPGYSLPIIFVLPSSLVASGAEAYYLTAYGKGDFTLKFGESAAQAANHSLIIPIKNNEVESSTVSPSLDF